MLAFLNMKVKQVGELFIKVNSTSCDVRHKFTIRWNTFRWRHVYWITARRINQWTIVFLVFFNFEKKCPTKHLTDLEANLIHCVPAQFMEHSIIQISDVSINAADRTSIISYLGFYQLSLYNSYSKILTYGPTLT